MNPLLSYPFRRHPIPAMRNGHHILAPPANGLVSLRLLSLHSLLWDAKNACHSHVTYSSQQPSSAKYVYNWIENNVYYCSITHQSSSFTQSSKAEASKAQKSSKSANIFEDNGGKDLVSESSKEDRWNGSINGMSFTDIRKSKNGSGIRRCERELWIASFTMILLFVCDYLFWCTFWVHVGLDNKLCCDDDDRWQRKSLTCRVQLKSISGITMNLFKSILHYELCALCDDDGYGGGDQPSSSPPTP